jgi:hypothetical protein
MVSSLTGGSWYPPDLADKVKPADALPVDRDYPLLLATSESLVRCSSVTRAPIHRHTHFTRKSTKGTRVLRQDECGREQLMKNTPYTTVLAPIPSRPACLGYG